MIICTSFPLKLSGGPLFEQKWLHIFSCQLFESPSTPPLLSTPQRASTTLKMNPTGAHKGTIESPSTFSTRTQQRQQQTNASVCELAPPRYREPLPDTFHVNRKCTYNMWQVCVCVCVCVRDMPY